MWRKPDGKPSSDPPNSPSATPVKTQTDNPVQPKPASFDASPAVAAPVPRFTPEPVAPGASRIGAGLKIRGEISGNADLTFDGEVNGKIRVMGGQVTVGPTGKIQADIDARDIVIDGSVQGNLKADAKLRLGSTSRVEGALTAPSIAIDDGARFRGKVEVTRSKPAGVAPGAPAKTDAASLKTVGVHAETE